MPGFNLLPRKADAPSVSVFVLIMVVLLTRINGVVCEGFMNIANLLRVHWLNRQVGPQTATGGLRDAVWAYELATRCMNGEERHERLASLAYWRQVISSQEAEWSASIPLCGELQTNSGIVRGGSFGLRLRPLALRNDVWLRWELPRQGLDGEGLMRQMPLANQANLVRGTFVGEWRTRQGTPAGFRPQFPLAVENYRMVSDDTLRGIVAEIAGSAKFSTVTVRSADARVTGGDQYLLAAQVRAIGGTSGRLAVAWFADRPQGSMPTHRLKVEFASACQANPDGWNWLVRVVNAPSDALFAQIWLQNHDCQSMRFSKVLFCPLPRF